MVEVEQEITHLRRIAESFDDYLKLGDLYLKLHKFLEARYYYSQLIKRNPNDIRGFLKMGFLSILLDNYREANNYYSDALKLDNRNIHALMGLAKVHLHWNGLEKAFFNLTTANKLISQNPEILFLLGVVHFRRLEIFYAEKYLREAITLLQVGKTTLKKEQSSKLEFLQDAASFYLGTVEAQKGLYQNALNEYTMLEDHTFFNTEHAENYQALWNNIGIAQYRLGEYAYAKIAFQNVLDKLEPSQVKPQIWVNLAMIHWMQEDYNSATQALENAHRIAPTLWPWMKELKAYQSQGSAWLKERLGNMLTENPDPDGVNIGLYLGCVIPNRYPFIDAATRHVLNALQVGVMEMEGAGCCPAPGVFRSFDINTWLTLGARNITIAEEMNRNLCIMCNGCYGTLNDINTELKHDTGKREYVNEKLSKIGKTYQGLVEAEHLVWILYHDVGMEKIKKMITHKLDLKVAIHYGCHILKPTHNKPWKDDFETPTFLDEMVELTGCTSVDYRDKLMCCGAGGGLRGSEKEVSLDFTREKLEAMRQAGVDIIVDCCPFCHLQFDLGQMEINSIFKDQISSPFSIPVIYISQLLGLAMGIDPFSLGILRQPKRNGVPPFTPVDPLFTRLQRDLDLTTI
ncbi:MAG: CoB--CoM heterodisulfide reductase subunit B [Promethearchaeota archaeon]